ncbi:MAG TPA: S24 family peptidase, partial [Anaerolineales bacterium]
MGRTHDKKDRTGKTLAAIEKLVGDDVNPSLRRIGNKIGVKSTSLVRFYVEDLEKRGKIRRNKDGKISIVSQRSATPNIVRRKKAQIALKERNILDIPNYGPIAAGYPLLLPDASFKKNHKGDHEQTVVHIPESYLPAGVKTDDVFALYVEGESMRDAMLTDGDIVILQTTSFKQVKNGDIVAAWLSD